MSSPHTSTQKAWGGARPASSGSRLLVTPTLRTQAPAWRVTAEALLGLGVSNERLFIISLGSRLSRGQEGVWEISEAVCCSDQPAKVVCEATPSTGKPRLGPPWRKGWLGKRLSGRGTGCSLNRWVSTTGELLGFRGHCISVLQCIVHTGDGCEDQSVHVDSYCST